MISLKTLKDEIKDVQREQKDRIKQKEWAEVHRLQEVLETLEFVRDWKD
jgi:hypothetical protein